MNRFLKYTMLMLVLMFTSGFAQGEEEPEPKAHAFSGTMALGFDAGVTWPRSDYNRQLNNLAGKIYLDYYLPTTTASVFGIRGFVSRGLLAAEGNDFNKPETFNTTVTTYGGGAIFSFSHKNVIFPYVFAGLGYIDAIPEDNNGNLLPGKAANAYAEGDLAYLGEVGIKFLASQEVAFTINVGYNYSNSDFWDDIESGSSNDNFFTTNLGVSYSFFTTSDSDGDGVYDEDDRCPDTPKNAEVDEFGCPLDSDNDGVADYMDECPNTPANVEVNENGCALDADMDGVPNYLDKCPNTPAGMQVNEEGCPDTDRDGVADNLDNCPDTPAGAKVDSYGCPLDTDNDGVPDYMDECENTPIGKQVDEKGCATEVVTVIKEKYKKVTLSGDTNFEFNKAILLPAAHEMLKPVLETMKTNKDTKWKITGHTDSVGSERYNQKLSIERAQAVADYFINNGIDSDRLKIDGKGEDEPIADNATPPGRAMNRRVEIQLIESK